MGSPTRVVSSESARCAAVRKGKKPKFIFILFHILIQKNSARSSTNASKRLPN